MKNNTRTGLLLIMIGLALGIISNIALYFVNFDVDIDNIDDIYISMAPAILFMVIGAIISLIGGILIITGREDYGERHSKFVIYAIVIFVINFFIAIILSSISSAMDPANSFMLFSKPTLADYEPIILLTVVSSVISAILGGLTYVFLFYHLESDNGRILLFTAYFISLVVAIVVAIYNHAVFTEMMRDLLASNTVDSSTVSQATSQLSNMSKAAIFSSISAILFIWAAYIPYKRIKTGELKPVLPKHLKRCMNCGRVTPSDSVVCAYCGSKIINYDHDNNMRY